jgi:4-amino-4-deoxychorismate lyase
MTVSKEGANHLNVTAAAVPCFASDPTLPSLFNPLSDPEAVPSSPIRVYLDTEATIPSIFTKTKTTFRNVYGCAKQRNEAILRAVPSGTDSDILLYNQHGEIMETTIFNVAFYRDFQWVTPAASSGCLGGVMRRWLLENGRIREGILTKHRICEDEWVLLFNGVQGCRLGKLYRQSY